MLIQESLNPEPLYKARPYIEDCGMLEYTPPITAHISIKDLKGRKQE